MKSILTIALAFLLAIPALSQPNRKPVITGQQELSVDEDKSIVILMSYLIVVDPDNWLYPWGFTMKLHPGANYTLQDHVVTPAPNFNGTLTVKVTVNDGKSNSNPFNMRITVNPVNDMPVVTGHSDLSISEDQTIAVGLGHLMVVDPDNNYPADFTLTVHSGNNYSTNGNIVTPKPGFTGTLLINVSVNDGTVSSDVFALPVSVKAIDRIPRIVGQSKLEIAEEESLTILLSHLDVVDEDNDYPTGFTLTVAPGQNYLVEGNTVTGASDFSGTLTVPVTVSDGTNTSAPFNLLVIVTPVNDAPVVTELETDPILYNSTSGMALITETLRIQEPDGDSIAFAEIAIELETYQMNVDQLVYTPAPGHAGITGTFDTETGVLVLSGPASPERFESAIRSVQYERVSPSNRIRKAISIVVHDGELASEPVVREVLFGKVVVGLDIPSGFTPNGDQANDTWVIIPSSEEEMYSQARVRIYNQNGILVYETVGFNDAWDGTFKGRTLPAGTYFYTIELNIDSPEGYLKGVVTLLR